MDWLYRAEPQLSEDVPVGGDRDLVSDLMDKHKVGVLGRAGGCLLRPGPVGPLGSDSPRAALGSAPALPAAPRHTEQCWGAPRTPRTPRTVHLGHLQSHWDPRQLPLPPALSPSGLPEGAGQASQLHQDAEALGAGPDPRQQQRGLPVAAEADGGAEHAVGPGLQALRLQAGPAGGCAPAGAGGDRGAARSGAAAGAPHGKAAHICALWGAAGGAQLWVAVHCGVLQGCGWPCIAGCCVGCWAVGGRVARCCSRVPGWELQAPAGGARVRRAPVHEAGCCMGCPPQRGCTDGRQGKLCPEESLG